MTQYALEFHYSCLSILNHHGLWVLTMFKGVRLRSHYLSPFSNHLHRFYAVASIYHYFYSIKVIQLPIHLQRVQAEQKSKLLLS